MTQSKHRALKVRAITAEDLENISGGMKIPAGMAPINVAHLLNGGAGTMPGFGGQAPIAAQLPTATPLGTAVGGTFTGVPTATAAVPIAPATAPHAANAGGMNIGQLLPVFTQLLNQLMHSDGTSSGNGNAGQERRSGGSRSSGNRSGDTHSAARGGGRSHAARSSHDDSSSRDTAFRRGGRDGFDRTLKGDRWGVTTIAKSQDRLPQSRTDSRDARTSQPFSPLSLYGYTPEMALRQSGLTPAPRDSRAPIVSHVPGIVVDNSRDPMGDALRLGQRLGFPTMPSDRAAPAPITSNVPGIVIDNGRSPFSASPAARDRGLPSPFDLYGSSFRAPATRDRGMVVDPPARTESGRTMLASFDQPAAEHVDAPVETPAETPAESPAAPIVVADAATDASVA